MRLTHVASLSLPFGPLLSYELAVSAPGEQLPPSFDQSRHVGLGDRAGSWMALALHLDAPVERDHLAAAWTAVVRSHGTLNTAFVAQADGPATLHEITCGPGEWIQHEIAPGQPMGAALQGVLDAHCRPLSRPSHRLCLIETADGPTLVVAADHSHVDMWSMLVIVRDLLAALAAVQQGEHPTSPPAPAFVEHTRALRDRPAAPPEIHRRWRELIEAGDGAMPRFPLSLGAPGDHPERVVVRDVLDADALEAFSARARQEGVSTLALTISAMTSTTRALAGTALRAVFPVHSRYEERWHDSVGWFITNSVLDSADPDPSACAAALKESLRLGSHPLAEVLAPWGGMPEEPGMLAISWLDMRRLPVTIDTQRLDAQYISAGIRTDGVMLWFSTDSDGIHLRCRFPDTPEARVNVGAWLDDLVARVRRAGTADDRTGAER
ncbi:condensation domain-containing protein [Brachybacterium saurashtrense]|uniref:Peptide synthetase n=1 Tax=Brachybacterium saurashtrense TaxID=556288 RepID=A0A345YP51_9MICO|nr:condensation domain-containing protein [Brachybacterium saurashtrense]AXK45703.1 peptide synthetase [Brachybacterium saurashtrense]RRR24721.1 peptide synthetase [Brachybacterium saurashtrense]